MLNNFFRLFNTLKYLQLKQLCFFVLRRKFPAKVVAFNGDPSTYKDLQLAPPITIDNIWENDKLTFLNISKPAALAGFDWSPKDTSRLWRYNLHYFDYLRDAKHLPSLKADLLSAWIANNPQSTQPGWEPFTASLRIVNWIFFLQSVGRPLPLSEDYLQSLYIQTLWLEKNDEKHILANHYFENLKALCFAGCFFTGADAKRWRNKATRQLKIQLVEQTLPDGGHYERTPQYHALMLENYLDLYNLVSHNPSLFDSDLIELLEKTCRHGSVFLQDILFPDGGLPLFNDSAFGIAPTINKLQDYAGRLLDDVSCAAKHTATLINKPDSGLYGYRSQQDMFVIDCGDIGPDYQPGHTHCDFLSYELMLSGRRIIVDSGVYEYEPGEMRALVRSTKAHNTLSVDGDEQSEIWGEFRLARRAKKIAASIEQNGQYVEFCGAYRGFYAVGGNIVHQRKVSMASDDLSCIRKVAIVDTVRGGGEHYIESYIHLHPDIQAVEDGRSGLLLTDGNSPLARLIMDERADYRVEEGLYCPEFGKKITNQLLIMSCRATLPLQMSYTLLIE